MLPRAEVRPPERFGVSDVSEPAPLKRFAAEAGAGAGAGADAAAAGAAAGAAALDFGVAATEGDGEEAGVAFTLFGEGLGEAFDGEAFGDDDDFGDASFGRFGFDGGRGAVVMILCTGSAKTSSDCAIVAKRES